MKSVESEQGLLSSLLQAPREVLDYCVSKGITDESFSESACSIVYSAVCEMSAKNMAIDAITVTDYLRDIGKLDKLSINIRGDFWQGLAAVTSLYCFTCTTHNHKQYADTVFLKYVLRETVKTQKANIAFAEDNKDDIPAVVDKCQSSMLKISEMLQGKRSSKTIQEMVFDAMMEMEKAYEKKTGLRGMSTGFPALDKVTGGMGESEYIVIQAARSDGKTALAMTIASHLAVEKKVPVGVISLEMCGKDLVKRMISTFTKINTEQIFSGTWGSAYDLDKITKASIEIANSPIYIEDTPNQMMSEIASRARNLKIKHGIKLLVIDYIQLVKEDMKAGDKRHDRIAAISKDIKNIARELKIPVIALSQVNSEGEVAGSKEIINDCDQLWGISNREEKFFILINKNRNGARNQEVRINFDKPTCTFREIGEFDAVYSPKPTTSTYKRPRSFER